MLEMIFFVNIYVYVGIVILILVVICFGLCFVQGVLDFLFEELLVLKFIVVVMYGLFYLLMIVLFLIGMGKYYFGQKFVGDIYVDVLKVIFWVFIVLYVVGVLVQKFYFKIDVLDCMIKGVKV